MKTRQNLISDSGEMYYLPDVFSPTECVRLFAALRQNVHWGEKKIRIYGKDVLQPRLTAWYGDASAAYSYSGIRLQPLAWTEELKFIKSRVEEFAGTFFNSVLLNYYRNGRDSMGWHRDNEKELGTEPIIASVSFGATRKFRVRKYAEKDQQLELEPASGSLIIMKGVMQTYWEHSVPKQLKINEGRINLTFRTIINKT